MDVDREAIETAFDAEHAATTVYLARKYLAKNRGDLPVAVLYATMLYKLGRYDEAVEVFTRMVERLKDEYPASIVVSKLGHLERYRGNYAEAERWYREAIRIRPEDAAGYVYLGGTQARQGKLIEAEATHRMGTACREGATDEAHFNLGLVLRAQGQLEAAADELRAAIAIDPSYEEAMRALEDVENAIELAKASNA